MILSHLTRLWRDRRMLLCVLVALLLAVLLSWIQFGGETLADTRKVDLDELLRRYPFAAYGMTEPTRESFELWFANDRLGTQLYSTETGIILAVVIGSYIIGSSLSRPLAISIYAGRSKWGSTLQLCGVTAIIAALTSLLLTLLLAVVYRFDCLLVLGVSALPRLLRAAGWRLLFDLAAFCPIVILGFLSREMYLPLCGGAALAALTTILGLMKEELWWFPTYAAQTVMIYYPSGGVLWYLVRPSVVMIAITPIFAVLRMARCEMK